MVVTNVDLLVRADYLYPMDGALSIVPHGEVAVQDGRITYAGPRRPEGTWQAPRTIEGSGKALLPGFVNCHTHTASLVFRSQTDDFSGGVALYTVAFRMEKLIGPDEWYDLALLGCADMIKNGVTTINDIWYSPDMLARAVEAGGLRAVIANKVFDVALENLRHGDYTRDPRAGEARLREGIQFVEAWHGKAGGRILGRLATHATDTCAPELHREARAEARRLGVGMHIHAAQSKREVEHIAAAHGGKGPLEYLASLEFLAPDVTLAHLNFATDGDLRAVKEAGARYAHCPTIYPRRGRYPRLTRILDEGIPTGFATDWMQNDPWEGMRNAINVSRTRANDPDLLPTGQVLWLSTMGGARALGLEDQVGSLEAGKRADMILVDLDQPHLQPFYGSCPALVFYARGSDVHTSIIDGRVVMENRRLTGIDERDALDRVRRRLPDWKKQLIELGSPTLAGEGAKRAGGPGVCGW